LTARRLVQSPFHGYPRLACRTGDFGRLLPDGNVAYHGRMDNMVKSRGYRIELGEVESAVSACTGVLECAVVPVPHEKYGNSLYAFVVLAEGGSVSVVNAELSRLVPSYMLPYSMVAMSVLPKTATGKVDRVSLKQTAEKGELVHV
jgi:acyl-coenzyme A synthetase/AMP-(fatty) acid ligase